MGIHKADWIVPIGTQVVTLVDVKNSGGEVVFMAGTVGTIVKIPTDPAHSYRIRLIDDTEVALKHSEFAIHSDFQRQGLDSALEPDLYDHIIYRCIIGSRAYGLDQTGSDTDLRGIYLPPADMHWSLYGIPDQLENQERQECYWELQKFIILALKANPNILECLYTPLVEMAAPLAQELIAMRSIFLSKLVFQTYNGYVLSQFRKLQKDIENHGAIKWKHAMHLIRLLLSGITVLGEGDLPVRVVEHRDRLLEIRRGAAVWEEVDAWRLQLHKEFEAAFRTTRLPDRPDYEKANAFLVKARRSRV